MIHQEQICSALGKLIGWLETWRDATGAYQGFIVHRTEAKRMKWTHDTAWTQAAMIRGYGNLYRRRREARWGEKMTQAADLQAARYDPQTGRIRFTGHEDDRFQSLVGCALAVCALLSVADLVDEERRKRYVQLAADHVRRYWFEVLWVAKEGAFKFTEFDYYSPHEDRFVVNFNTMAAEALLAVHRATGVAEFRQRALQVGEWLLAHWDENQKHNEKILAEAGQAPTVMPPGGFSYQFTAKRAAADNYVTLYTGLSLRGLWALFQATGNERFATIIREQSRYLLAMCDPATHLFRHTTLHGRIEKNPLFIAGTGMTLVGLHEVMPLIGESALPEETVRAVLRLAYKNGSYPGFFGKNDTGHPRRSGGGVVWEDVAATTNWNAQFFEYLTRLAEDPEGIRVVEPESAVRIRTRRFFYRDSPRRTTIISWWPPKSWGLYLFEKRKPRAQLSFYPAASLGRLRVRLRGMLHD